MIEHNEVQRYVIFTAFWGNRNQMWRVAMNILNKQSRTADKEWSFNLGIGGMANISAS
jgi:hypothetical protein